MFNYGGFKLFLFKFIVGLSLVFLSTVLIISLVTFSPNDPGFGKFSANKEIENFFGFLGAIASSFLMIFFGGLSIVVLGFIFYTGVRLVIGLQTSLIILRFILVNKIKNG